MNEAETRAELIDPKLKVSGWGEVEGSKIHREFRINLGRLQTGGKRAKPEISCAPPCKSDSRQVESPGVKSKQRRFKMSRKRYSEEQIIQILKKQEAGVSTQDVCREASISTATFYKWKAKFGGMEVSDARRLRGLEEENRKLKRIVADQALDNMAMKELLSKNF